MTRIPKFTIDPKLIKELGAYQLVKRRGSSRRLYEAYDRRLRRSCTLAVVPLGELPSAAVVEAERARPLLNKEGHPVLIPSFEIKNIGNTRYCLLPLRQRGTLGDTLQQGPLSRDNTARLIDQIADILDYVHDRGRIHAQVNPYNVVLDESGSAKLAAASVDALMHSVARRFRRNQMHLIERYLAPEQLREEPVTQGTDVYALGAIAYEMVAGKAPFEGEGRVALLEQMKASPVGLSAITSAIGKNAAGIIGAALSNDPMKRPESARVFASSLRMALEAYGRPKEHLWEQQMQSPVYQTQGPRFVNVYLVNASGDVVAKTTDLARTSRYALRINIGSLLPESVVENAREKPFPIEALPESRDGHWLEVVVDSQEFSIETPRLGIYLPRLGQSWSCDCPMDREHVCLPQERRQYVAVSLATPNVLGIAELRLGIYYQRNLVQSQLLTAQVADTERTGDGYSAWIDYTLSARLDNIATLEGRTANIITNASADGSHRIIINAGDSHGMAFRLSEGKMTATMEAARQGLYNIHIGGVGPGRRNLYDNTNAKNKAAFVKDLERLAVNGWGLLTGLADNDSGRLDELRLWLKAPSVIQVSRVGGSQFVFPWGLVYDIPLWTRGQLRHCRLLTDWEGGNLIGDEVGFECPFQEEHSPETLCPFGFWGYRHIIEQPPSMPQGRDLATVIRVAKERAEGVVGRSLQLDKRIAKEHLSAMRTSLHDFELRDCDSVKAMLDSLGEPTLELLYLYCHGRRRAKTQPDLPMPALLLGSEDEIVPPDLAAWRAAKWSKEHWQATGPLVFINGCHTVDLLPRDILSFVDAFTGVYASGVIGTEIEIHQRVASEAAEHFLIHFRQGKSVGRAIQEMRRALLNKGNVMGLAYTAYCSASLRLERTRAA